MTRAPFDERLQAAKTALSDASNRREAKAAEPRAPAPLQTPQPEIYFAAIPFLRNAEGELIAGRALRQPSAGAAEGEARRMAKSADGAMAFSRAGDSTRGIFDDLVVIRTFGDVPAGEIPTPDLSLSPPKTKPA